MRAPTLLNCKSTLATILKLVIVQTGANATGQAGDTSLGREREAVWRGIIRHCDKN